MPQNSPHQHPELRHRLFLEGTTYKKGGDISFKSLSIKYLKYKALVRRHEEVLMRNNSYHKNAARKIAASILAALAIYPASVECKDTKKSDVHVEAVYTVMRRCSEIVMEYFISEAALTGGYFVRHEPSTDSDIPYYSYSGKKHIPKIGRIEKNIEGLVEQMVPMCVQTLREKGINASSESSPKVNVTFKPDRANIELRYKIKFWHHNTHNYISYFSGSIDSEFLNMYNYATDIVNKTFDSPYGHCMSCAVQLGARYSFCTVSISGEEGSEFIIRERKSKKEGEEENKREGKEKCREKEDGLKFRFAVKQ